MRILMVLVLAAGGCPKSSPPMTPHAELPSEPVPDPVERIQPTQPTQPTPSTSDAPDVPESPEALAAARAVETLLDLNGSVSTSDGSPNAGTLRGGVQLPAFGRGFRHNPARERSAAFGTVETLQTLVRAAAGVVEAIPNSELTINDVSAESGGPIRHHGSHQSGRDADVLFYYVDAQGEPMPAKGAFVDLSGRGVDFADLAVPEDDVDMILDLARTWRFVQTLLSDPNSQVQRMFVVEHVRSMLLEYARDADAPPDVIERFADVTCQPSYPHDDHFHIRFFCTPEDIQAGCQDSAPIYPWHRAYLREEGVRVNRADPRIRHRAPVTTHEEARAEAGEMHSRVTEWLERREAWVEQPRVGRRYCR